MLERYQILKVGVIIKKPGFLGRHRITLLQRYLEANPPSLMQQYMFLAPDDTCFLTRTKLWWGNALTRSLSERKKVLRGKKRCGRSHKYNLGLVGRPSLGWNTRCILFINGWDLSHMSRWERAVRKHLKKEESFKKYFKSNWINVLSVALNMSPSDFSIISEGSM